MSGPPRISLVVAHYEQHDDLARTLACLRRQSIALHEVVVTDDGSAQPPRVGADVELVTQADRGFRAGLARNRGAELTTGDVLVFLDADTAPEPTYVERIVAPLHDEPDLLVVGHRRHSLDGEPDPDGPLPEPAWLADGWRRSDDLRAADASSFRYVISAAMACDARWWRRVAGFDTTFDRYGGEDWELAHRWWTAGGRLRHVPDAVAWHHGPDAGARPADPARATGETVAIARRVGAAPVAFRGLLAAPARVVVTHADTLDDRELLVSVDGLLAEQPAAVVVSGRSVLLDLGDPRVRPVDAGPQARAAAALGVHLNQGARSDGTAWTELLDAPGGPGDPGGPVETVVPAADGSVLVTLTDLRRQRRVELGLERPTSAHQPPHPGLRPVGDTTLAAWLGGWD